MDFLAIIYIVAGVLILPAIIYAIVAQAKVNQAFDSYSKILSSRNITAAQVANKLLSASGCKSSVAAIGGHLTDNYNPKTDTVSLSQSVYDSTSVASIGIAAHEVGHAIQYKQKYVPIKFRNALIPFLNITNALLWPLIIIGTLMSVYMQTPLAGEIVMIVMISFYGLAVLLSVVTLPIEYNASNRAYKMLVSTNILTEDEAQGAKKVLTAASLTYVAGMLVSMVYFLRILTYFLMFFRRR